MTPSHKPSFTEALARVQYLHPLVGAQRNAEYDEYHRLLRQFPKLRSMYRRQPKANNTKR